MANVKLLLLLGVGFDVFAVSHLPFA